MAVAINTFNIKFLKSTEVSNFSDIFAVFVITLNLQALYYYISIYTGQT